MDITMPTTTGRISAERMQRCTMYLATCKQSGRTVTLMRVNNETVIYQNDRIMYVASMNASSFDSDWIDKNYSDIRDYKSGDTINIMF